MDEWHQLCMCPLLPFSCKHDRWLGRSTGSGAKAASGCMGNATIHLTATVRLLSMRWAHDVQLWPNRRAETSNGVLNSLIACLSVVGDPRATSMPAGREHEDKLPQPQPFWSATLQLCHVSTLQVGLHYCKHIRAPAGCILQHPWTSPFKGMAFHHAHGRAGQPRRPRR